MYLSQPRLRGTRKTVGPERRIAARELQVGYFSLEGAGMVYRTLVALLEYAGVRRLLFFVVVRICCTSQASRFRFVCLVSNAKQAAALSVGAVWFG